FRANFRQKPVLYLWKRSAHARAGGERMAASAEFLTDGADIDDIGFGPHAHSDLPFVQFFEKNGNNNTVNRPQMVDQPLVILGKDAQFSSCFQGEAKTCDAPFLLETHGAQQPPQKLQTPPRIILI